MSSPLQPPIARSDDSYEMVLPEDDGLLNQVIMPYVVKPAFENLVNLASGPVGTLLDVAYPYVPDVDMFDSLSFPSTHDYANWVADVGSALYSRFDSPVPLEVPSPRLVGIETNPGPNAMSKAAARRLRRAIRAEARAVAAVPPPPKQQRVSRAQQPRTAQLPTSVAAAYSTGVSTSKPSIVRAGDDSCRIKHSELLTLVSGTANFTANTFAMQPGLQTSFPWLSTQTVGWEKYRFNSLRATFYTRTGTSTAGSVILAPDYDPADSPPSSEQQATSFHGAADDAPWKTISVTFDMKRSRELFLRGGPLLANLDIKTYDFANLYICTADGAAVNWGKVFLEYDVTLLNPQILQGVYSGGSVRSGGVVTLTNPLGTIPEITPGSIVATVINGAASRVTMNNMVIGQNYIINFNVGGSGLTAISTVHVSGADNIVQLINDQGTTTSMGDIVKFRAASQTVVYDLSASGLTATGSWFLVGPVANTF